MIPAVLTRPFPFIPRPGHLETLDSYTRRVLEANGERQTLPRELLKLAKSIDSDTTWESIIATKTGRAMDRLTTPPTKSIHAEADTCKPCASLLSERWGCLQCNNGHHVQQHSHLDDFVCERHRRWVGPGSTPATQTRVGAREVAAQRKLRRLHRGGRADMQLLTDVTHALVRDLEEPAHAVFAKAVAIVGWVTHRETLHRLFDPAEPYASTFAWASECLASLAAKRVPSAARAVWMHLWPAHIALRSAFRGYAGYHAGHPHDFALPADITSWYPHPHVLPSDREYLECTGDDNLSALANRAGESRQAPSTTRPQTRRTWCQKGHPYLEVVTGDQANEPHITVCPQCTRSRVTPGENDLATVAPVVARELHPTLNGDLTAKDIAGRSNERVWWLCTEKKHPFLATPANRTLTDSSCPVCLNRVILRGVNDFATTHPVIARELHPSSSSAKRAWELTATDTKRRDWLCACGYEYRESVANRVKGRSCPECKKRRVRKSGRSLVDTHPHLASTWLPELNEGREPADYTRGSKLDVVWWCENGQHPFPMRIEARTRGCTCGYCAGRRLLQGFNDFATTHPELAPDWHHYRNRKYATEVMAGSNDKHYWLCKDGHATEQSIPHRIESGGCVECPAHERPGRRASRSRAA